MDPGAAGDFCDHIGAALEDIEIAEARVNKTIIGALQQVANAIRHFSRACKGTPRPGLGADGELREACEHCLLASHAAIQADVVHMLTVFSMFQDRHGGLGSALDPAFASTFIKVRQAYESAKTALAQT